MRRATGSHRAPSRGLLRAIPPRRDRTGRAPRGRPRDLLLLVLLPSLWFVVGCGCGYLPSARCLRLDGQPEGRRFEVGAVIADERILVEVEPLAARAAGDAGVSIVAGKAAGGKGLEAQIDGVTCHYLLPYPLSNLSLRFHEGAGEERLVLNGSVYTVGGLDELDGAVLGGVRITVTDEAPAADGRVGRLELAGRITDFRLGGEDLRIDDICYQEATG